ncbi:MAG: phosphoribosylformylglycinamidine synthase subunit PurS [Candidatus Ratteibacteria bacterium]|nr:phosphoribosylformylglycinamidine synthase subunit PurS [Candidatus Ratteibacteria bacterium]
MLNVEIYITLKKTVSDPQGLTIKHALESLGYQNLQEVRVGKLVTITLNSEDKKKAKQKINEMCRKLLANLIIEDYSFRIKEV